MTVDLHVVEIVALLRTLTAQVIASQDLDDALSRLAGTAAGLLDCPAWCGVTVVHPDGVRTAAASAGLPGLLDDVQYAAGDGPCMTAIRTRELVLSRNLGTEQRWPLWCAQAREQGVRAALSAPIDIDEHIIGAVNLYTGEPDRFPPALELTVLLLAEHAGLLMSAVLDRDRLATRTAEVTAALGDGEIVNRAIGIVMAQRVCSPEEALDVLYRTSSTLRLPLAVVAERLVDTVASRAAPPRQATG